MAHSAHSNRLETLGGEELQLIEGKSFRLAAPIRKWRKLMSFR